MATEEREQIRRARSWLYRLLFFYASFSFPQNNWLEFHGHVFHHWRIMKVLFVWSSKLGYFYLKECHLFSRFHALHAIKWSAHKKWSSKLDNDIEPNIFYVPQNMWICDESAMFDQHRYCLEVWCQLWNSCFFVGYDICFH